MTKCTFVHFCTLNNVYANIQDDRLKRESITNTHFHIYNISWMVYLVNLNSDSDKFIEHEQLIHCNL